MFEEDKLYTALEVMDILRISKTLFEKMVKSKKIKTIRISEKVRRFKGKQLNTLCVES